MLPRHLLVAIALAVTLSPVASLAVEDKNVPAAPASVAPREFAWNSLKDPETLFWPSLFWWWNGTLDPALLREQISDMKAHDVRNVEMFFLSNDHRPGDYHMDPDYLTPEFFQRVKFAVDEAARLDMDCWLYDEGAWPTGRILRHRPDFASRYATCQLAYRDGKWTQMRDPSSYVHADFLDPKTTAVFIETTHQPYVDLLGPKLGSTVKFMFTDEPAYQYISLGRSIPWTPGGDALFQSRFGYNVLDDHLLDAFAVTDVSKLTPAQKKVRVDVFDFLSGRYRDTFFLPKRDWCRQHGLVHCGHLGGEDESLSPVRHGYGSAMRQLRTMDMPGVDAIWRQIFPGKRCEMNFPKLASSVIHQNGTALAFTESFAVYGSGLTPAEMKWVIDYQFVRGINIYLGSNYPVTTRDNSMTGERPRFSPVEPLWDFLPDFHRYVARLSYLIACGQPAIDTAVYYPLRDIWANGSPSDPALCTFNAISQALLDRQCDYDFIDDDVLSDPATHSDDGRLAVGPMRYRTIIVGPTQWITESARKRLDAFQAAGGHLIRLADPAQIDTALAKITPTVQLDPPSPDIRTLLRRWPGGGAVFLFNEGEKPYSGRVSVALDGTPYQLDPVTGTTHALPSAVSGKESRGEGGPETNIAIHTAPLGLSPGQSALYLSATQPPPKLAPPIASHSTQSLDLPDAWTARVDRQYVVGEHDFEIHPADNPQFKPVSLNPWAKTLSLGEDFSGWVTYRRTIDVPESMRSGRLLLDLAPLQYAARVSIDGRQIGRVLWSPWQIELPSLEGRARFVLEVQVTNTLANQLTSERVQKDWSNRKGPGWPTRYNAREIEFEKESRGGGLLGPVQLHLATP